VYVAEQRTLVEFFTVLTHGTIFSPQHPVKTPMLIHSSGFESHKGLFEFKRTRQNRLSLDKEGFEKFFQALS